MCALAAAAALGGTLPGCVRQPSQGSLAPGIEGHWAIASGPRQLELMLTRQGNRVNGYGRLSGPDGGSPLTIKGEFTGSDFALDLINHDQVIGHYRGRLDWTDTMRGVIDDAGSLVDSLILSRQSGQMPLQLFGPKWCCS